MKRLGMLSALLRDIIKDSGPIKDVDEETPLF